MDMKTCKLLELQASNLKLQSNLKSFRTLDDGEIMYPVEAEAVVSIQTGRTAALSIFVYHDQVTANQTLSKGEKIMSTAKFKDTFYLEGEAKHLKIKKRIYWSLLTLQIHCSRPVSPVRCFFNFS